jgi:hypothetical protein
MTKRIACIGSRGLKVSEVLACESIGRAIAERGWELHTGNAKGADQAFARGANEVNPKLVHLHLPWYKYERDAIVPGNVVRCVDDLPEWDLGWYTEFARGNHPAWSHLKQGVRKLMIRNGMIIAACEGTYVDVTIAWPSDKMGGGGTGQGMRMSAEVKATLIDLAQTNPEWVVRMIQEAP